MARGWLSGLWLGVAAAGANAADFPPLSNYATLARGFDLPVLGQPRVQPPSTPALQLALDLSNEFENLGINAAGNCVAAECLRADGEDYRLNVSYRGALGSNWDWGVALPVLWRSGGFLDAGIERWHDWFGLPNNGRERYPRNRYRYFYRRDGQTLIDTTDASAGIGDVTLGAGRALGDLALRGELKLPTGDEDRLTGGNLGGALWLDAGLPWSGAWSGYASAGASLNDRNGPLQDQQNRLVPFGGFGAAAQVTPRFQLHSQLYFHGRLYHDTELRNLYRYGAILGVGGRYTWSSGVSLDAGLIEDLDVNVSPDFDLQLVLTWK